MSDATRLIYDAPGSTRLRADWMRAQGRDGNGDRSAARLDTILLRATDRHATQRTVGDAKHMTRLRKIVGLTLAVVLATALVAYMLRPSAAPTTSSTTTTKPPTDTTCGEQTRGMKELTCGLPTGTTNGGGQGSNGDHDTDDHDDHGNHGGDSDDHDGGHGGHGDGGHHDGEGPHGEHGGASDPGPGDHDDS